VSSPTEAIREQLMVSSQEYQRLRDEHARYAAQLEQLASKSYLSEHDKLEEIRLKKLKLRIKDQMEMLVRRARIA
jgi:hypothetical protein